MNPMLNEANAHERLPQRKSQPQDERARVIEEIAVGDAPWSLAKRPGADRIYVTNKESATISIISIEG